MSGVALCAISETKNADTCRRYVYCFTLHLRSTSWGLDAKASLIFPAFSVPSLDVSMVLDGIFDAVDIMTLVTPVVVPPSILTHCRNRSSFGHIKHRRKISDEYPCISDFPMQRAVVLSHNCAPLHRIHTPFASIPWAASAGHATHLFDVALAKP